MGLAQMSCGSEVDQKKYTQSCNLPIQGQCADAAMGAFIRVVHRLKEAGIPGGPVLWLHDEIVLEVPIEFAEQIAASPRSGHDHRFRRGLPGAPLRGLVAARIGDTWAATKKEGSEECKSHPTPPKDRPTKREQCPCRSPASRHEALQAWDEHFERDNQLRSSPSI